MNDYLFTGPKFDQRTIDILLRSRVALTADIEQAFLQICIDEQDQMCCGFSGSRACPSRNMKFTHVVFGMSSPFLLNATIRHHLKKYVKTHTEFVKRILESIYADNVVSGADTEKEAFSMYQDSKAMPRARGFNLHKVKHRLFYSCVSLSFKRRMLDTPTP